MSQYQLVNVFLGLEGPVRKSACNNYVLPRSKSMPGQGMRSMKHFNILSLSNQWTHQYQKTPTDLSKHIIQKYPNLTGLKLQAIQGRVSDKNLYDNVNP